jgi:hypothetical protein
MQTTITEPETETWTHIAPLLDGAMERLGRKDHDALVLRFFENKNFAEVGAAMGASEDAAKMRVNRALEKLRKIFTKRGVSSTVAMLAGAISANSVQAAPVGLALKISAVAVAKGAAAGTTTLTLVKGALKIMAWTKMKTAVAVGVGVLPWPAEALAFMLIIRPISIQPPNCKQLCIIRSRQLELGLIRIMKSSALYFILVPIVRRLSQSWKMRSMARMLKHERKPWPQWDSLECPQGQNMDCRENHHPM